MIVEFIVDQWWPHFEMLKHICWGPPILPLLHHSLSWLEPFHSFLATVWTATSGSSTSFSLERARQLKRFVNQLGSNYMYILLKVFSRKSIFQTIKMYGDVGIAEQQKVKKKNEQGWWHKTVQYTTPYIFFSLYMYYVERYVRWGCILNCFMPSSLLVFLLFAVLLSLHLHSSFTFVIMPSIILVNLSKWLLSYIPVIKDPISIHGPVTKKSN